MYQKALILKKWEEAGLEKSENEKVRNFISFVEKSPRLGWDFFIKELQTNYYEAFKDVIPPIMEINDNLINLNLVVNLDPKKYRKELNLLKEYIKKADPQKFHPTLVAIAKLEVPSLTKILEQRKDLPSQLRAILLELKHSAP